MVGMGSSELCEADQLELNKLQELFMSLRSFRNHKVVGHAHNFLVSETGNCSYNFSRFINQAQNFWFLETAQFP